MSTLAENHHSAASSPPHRREWRRTAAAILVLTLLVVGFYWKLTLSRQYTWLAGDDITNQVLPWWQFQARELQAGRFPAAWDPYVWLGQPLIGQAQPGAMYPLNWILFLLPLRNGYIAEGFLHWYFVVIHIIAAFNAFALARYLGCSRAAAILAGAVFSFSGYVGSIDWPQMLNGAIWAPLVLLFFLRVLHGTRPVLSAALGGLFLGLSWLSGHHQIPTFVSWTMVFLWVWAVLRDRARWRNWTIAGALFWLVCFLISAAQTLPAYEYGKLAQRWVGSHLDPITWNQVVPYAVHTRFSFSPSSLLGVIFPGIWEHVDPFLGVTGLALVASAVLLGWKRLEVRLLLAIALGGLFYSLADHNFLHGIMYAVLPLLEKARSSSMALFLLHWGGAALAAIGLDLLIVTAREGSWGWNSKLVKLLAGLIVLVFALRLAMVAVKGTYDANLDDRFVLAGYAAAALAGLLAWLRLEPERYRLVTALLIVLFAFEASNVSLVLLMPHDSETQRLEPYRKLRERTPVADFLRRQPGWKRTDVDPETIRYNFGDWHGIETSAGYLASVTSNLRDVPLHEDPWRRLFGVAYAVRREPTAFYSEEVFAAPDGIKVFHNRTTMPRAFVAHEVSAVGSPKELAGAMNAIAAELPAKGFVLGNAAPKLETCPELSDSVAIEVHRADFVRLNVSAGCRGMLVLADLDYPGWEARIDGRPAEIVKAYGIARGVVVDSGKHTVEYRFRSKSVFRGTLLLVLGLLVVAAAAWVERRHS